LVASFAKKLSWFYTNFATAAAAPIHIGQMQMGPDHMRHIFLAKLKQGQSEPIDIKSNFEKLFK